MAWFVSSQYANSDQGTYLAPDVEPLPEDVARYKEQGLAARALIKQYWINVGRPEDSVELPFYGSSEIPPPMKGWRWPMFDRPLRAVVKCGDVGGADIISSGFGSYAVSQYVIDLIEEIEPGVHQYWPLELLNSNGSIRSSAFFILNVCSRAECIDTENSNVAWSRTGIVSVFGDITVNGGKPHVVAKAECVKGRALWSEWRYTMASSFMVSDNLWNALQREGLRGWQPHFSYPRHIEEI